jgi:hypothetical protein
MRQKETVLKHLNLPKYQVPWLRVPVSRLHPETPKSLIRTFNGQQYHVISMHPQVSFFQSPLLEFAPFVIAQMSPSSKMANESDKPAPQFKLDGNKSSEQLDALDLLAVMKPLINRYLLPPKLLGGHCDLTKLEARFFEQPKTANNRRKFT